MQTSLKKNFIMNAFLTMSSILFPLRTFPYVSRVLLPAGNGKVTFATSVITYFNMFAQLGIPTYGIRLCAQYRDNKYKLSKIAHELLFINLGFSIISYAVLFALIFYVPRFREDKMLFAVISLTILLTAVGMEWLYKALEQYSYITIRSIVFKFVALIAMFLLVHKKEDYVIYGGLSIFAASASSVLNLINARKYIYFKFLGDYNFKEHFKPIMVFFAMSCATVVYTNLDNIMLGFMTNDAAVGYYHAAVRVKALLVSIVTSLGAVLLPRSSYYVQQGKMTEFKRITNKALNFVFLVATPLAVYFIIFAKPAILLLSGTAYEGSIIPMQIIMPTLLLIGITNIMGIQILVPTGREKIVLYSEIAGAVVDIIINLILIPRFASAGAAVGTLVAEVVVLIVQYKALKNELQETMEKIHYLRLFIGIAIGTLLSSCVLTVELGNFLTLLVSSFLFFTGYGIYMLVSKEPLFVEILEQIVSVVSKGKKR